MTVEEFIAAWKSTGRWHRSRRIFPYLRGLTGYRPGDLAWWVRGGLINRNKEWLKVQFDSLSVSGIDFKSSSEALIEDSGVKAMGFLVPGNRSKDQDWETSLFASMIQSWPRNVSIFDKVWHQDGRLLARLPKGSSLGLQLLLSVSWRVVRFENVGMLDSDVVELAEPAMTRSLALQIAFEKIVCDGNSDISNAIWQNDPLAGDPFERWSLPKLFAGARHFCPICGEDSKRQITWDELYRGYVCSEGHSHRCSLCKQPWVWVEKNGLLRVDCVCANELAVAKEDLDTVARGTR